MQLVAPSVPAKTRSEGLNAKGLNARMPAGLNAEHPTPFLPPDFRPFPDTNGHPAPPNDDAVVPEDQVPPAHGDAPLSHRQHAAVMALTVGKSQTEIAERVGVSARTLRRWSSQPAFQAALRAQRLQFWADTIRPLQETTTFAIKALKEV